MQTAKIREQRKAFILAFRDMEIPALAKKMRDVGLYSARTGLADIRGAISCVLSSPRGASAVRLNEGADFIKCGGQMKILTTAGIAKVAKAIARAPKPKFPKRQPRTPFSDGVGNSGAIGLGEVSRATSAGVATFPNLKPNP